MIISHKFKFIFLKPRKVADTSVQVALAKHCGADDIITPTTAFTKGVDVDAYDDHARNFNGYFNHLRPSRVRQKVGQSAWDSYFKFSIVRNPWDMVVSRYFWNQKAPVVRKSPKQILAELRRDPLNIDKYGKLFFAIDRSLRGKNLAPEADFATFVKKLPHNISNTKYYFDWRGNPINDFVIRYEKLNEDYEQLCKKIGVPFEPLPQLKTKTRGARDYRELYTPELRDHIGKLFAKEIAFFGYTFDAPEPTE
ncbi:MAG: hypothetical protein COW24_00825 [Candidatus Kerfeldbacteria bacterium CG15_BIG_FIL_POST_REV_8_21_14_020_45_12]|uniref:Sulfotransferase family protein n=1 Tax=Candidatus Kerfeldbacteria bacterium CG15_BIG_FIL_POST_REV_8_21_14_020_45_12 TaxID=2014247 RepID=A0A2M7H500_9BACT|nr:MAG: hypothetical protein COW24_00825 [Candidatus Kerfeldbacteria bacterium CG15_BIG_FIL_POST_REV_8_21_14_020_45_12]